MGVRQFLYAYMATQEGPVWASEIAAGVKGLGGKWRGSLPKELCKEGLMRCIVTPGQPDSFLLVRKPSKWKHTPEEAAAALRAKYDKVNARKAAERRARGAKAVARKVKAHIVPKSPEGETVEEYLARGGQVDVLPGFQRDNVYPRRRPTWAANRSVAL